MSAQRTLFAAPAPADLLRQPIDALWPGGKEPKKGDTERVQYLCANANRDLRFEDATLGHLVRLPLSHIKGVLPKRLFETVESRMASLGIPLQKAPKWPGRKLVTDLWAAEYLQNAGRGYDWDLHLTQTGPAWKSSDHEAAMLCVVGAGATVLLPGVAVDGDLPPEVEAWHQDESRRVPVPAEAARAQLRLGQLVSRVGARWQPWKATEAGVAAEAVVVEETEDGWVVDTSAKARVSAVLRAAMAAHIQESLHNRDAARMSSFVRQYAVYMGGVLAQNAAPMPQNVIAFPWKASGHHARRRDTDGEVERLLAEREQQEQERERRAGGSRGGGR